MTQQSEEVDRLRADARRLAENHDQVVRWLREKEAEVDRLRKQVEAVVDEWVERHDCGDMTDDETLAVFAFIGDVLRPAIRAVELAPNPAQPMRTQEGSGAASLSAACGLIGFCEACELEGCRCPCHQEDKS